MKDHDIAFYLLVPQDKENEILRKLEGLYDSGLTVGKVGQLPKLDPCKTFCTELSYRKHDIFSLNTDRSNNYPLPSLLTAVRTLEGQDVAIFDAMLEPTNCAAWYKEARDAHNLLEKGYVPDNSVGGKLLRGVHQAFNTARYEILDLTRFTAQQREEFEKWKKDEGTFREARRLRREMSNDTRRKQDGEVVKAWLRIAVQSDQDTRARAAAYTMANAWKDINGDNELDRFDVPGKFTPTYLEAIEERKPLVFGLSR
jgi:hypothetical protein